MCKYGASGSACTCFQMLTFPKKSPLSALTRSAGSGNLWNWYCEASSCCWSWDGKKEFTPLQTGLGDRAPASGCPSAAQPTHTQQQDPCHGANTPSDHQVGVTVPWPSALIPSRPRASLIRQPRSPLPIPRATPPASSFSPRLAAAREPPRIASR